MLGMKRMGTPKAQLRDGGGVRFWTRRVHLEVSHRRSSLFESDLAITVGGGANQGENDPKTADAFLDSDIC